MRQIGAWLVVERTAYHRGESGDVTVLAGQTDGSLNIVTYSCSDAAWTRLARDGEFSAADLAVIKIDSAIIAEKGLVALLTEKGMPARLPA